MCTMLIGHQASVFAFNTNTLDGKTHKNKTYNTKMPSYITLECTSIILKYLNTHAHIHLRSKYTNKKHANT